MHRAAVSVPANIAEGVGEYAPKEKIRFYRIARRSAVECASHLLVSKKLELVKEESVSEGLGVLHRIVAMLTGMIRSVEGRGKGGSRAR